MFIFAYALIYMMYLKFKTALSYPILWYFATLNFKISSLQRTSRILKFYNSKIPSYFVFFALSLLVVALASM